MTQANNVAIESSQINSSGVLQVAGGGTGLATLTTGYIPYGAGTGPLSSSANLYFSGSQLGLGTTSPTDQLTVNAGNLGLIVSGGGASQFINFRNGGGTIIQQIQYSDADGSLNFGGTGGGAYPLKFSTSGTERMRITSTGGISFGSSGTAYGTAGQVLISQGNAAPVWVTNPAYTGSTYGVQYLVVAGGGGGGSNAPGGGGGGGVLQGFATVTSGTAYTVTVGAGGTAVANATGGNGGNSVFGAFATAIGGGGGGGSNGAGVAGGSGGGAGQGVSSYAAGTLGQGNPGGAGNGGGGGAGGPGMNGYGSLTTGTASQFVPMGFGGPGVPSTISGQTVYYGGGGAGYTINSSGTPIQQKAVSGGGAGSDNVNATPNSGGGGRADASAGAAGVVIISYVNPVQRGTGGTVTSYNGPQGLTWVHTFTTSGTYTA